MCWTACQRASQSRIIREFTCRKAPEETQEARSYVNLRAGRITREPARRPSRRGPGRRIIREFTCWTARQGASQSRIIREFTCRRAPGETQKAGSYVNLRAGRLAPKRVNSEPQMRIIREFTRGNPTRVNSRTILNPTRAREPQERLRKPDHT